jgi:hypothetical protein
VASDLLIFVRTGRPTQHVPAMNLAVWTLYFAGQTLIVLGVTQATTSGRRAEPLGA